jgi:hypothetical protein
MGRRAAAVLFALLTTCAAPPEPPAPDPGVPLLDWARRVAGRQSLDPVDLVLALRDVARRHKGSPERMLREAYFLLELWPEGAHWESVRAALNRDGVLNAEQWSRGDGKEANYRIRFTAQPSAWVSPGGHAYDLLVEADVKTTTAKGHKSWSVVKDPEAFLQAAIGLDRNEAARVGGYPPDSCFLKGMQADVESFGKTLSFITSIRARYRMLFNRWVELSSFGFDVDADFVDHPGARFNTGSRSYHLPSSLDPPIDWKRQLHPGREAESAFGGARGGGGSSIGDGHAFVPVDAGPPSKEGC